MDSRCLRDLDHLGNRNRRPRAARSGRLYIGFRGDLNPVDTSNPSSNLYINLETASRELVYMSHPCSSAAVAPNPTMHRFEDVSRDGTSAISASRRPKL